MDASLNAGFQQAHHGERKLGDLRTSMLKRKSMAQSLPSTEIDSLAQRNARSFQKGNYYQQWKMVKVNNTLNASRRSVLNHFYE